MARPDPIPNSAVKHSLADGSSSIGSARVGRRQSFNKKPENILLRLFYFFAQPVPLKEYGVFTHLHPLSNNLAIWQKKVTVRMSIG